VVNYLIDSDYIVDWLKGYSPHRGDRAPDEAHPGHQKYAPLSARPRTQHPLSLSVGQQKVPDMWCQGGMLDQEGVVAVG
jgi:hypothetical protein